MTNKPLDTEGPNYKQILINLIAGASLCDHMGDMASDLFEAARQAGFNVPDEVYDLDDLSEYLVKTQSAETLFGTSLRDDQ